MREAKFGDDFERRWMSYHSATIKNSGNKGRRVQTHASSVKGLEDW